MEPRNLLKPYFETSVTFDPFGFFGAVFTAVLTRMSSYHFIQCLYLLWGLFNFLSQKHCCAYKDIYNQETPPPSPARNLSCKLSVFTHTFMQTQKIILMFNVVELWTSNDCCKNIHVPSINYNLRCSSMVSSSVTLLSALFEHLIISQPLDGSDSYMVL